MDLGGWAFGDGKIFSDFHISGSTPSLREVLKIAASGLLIMLEKSFKIYAAISSGPVAFVRFNIVQCLLNFFSGCCCRISLTITHFETRMLIGIYYVT